jgi:hypothetical protein
MKSRIVQTELFRGWRVRLGAVAAPLIRASVSSMCDKCLKLDEKIQHYRRLAHATTDRLTLVAINDLIAKVETQKTQLHPERAP